MGDHGDCVVKDLGSGDYYNLGPQESFLLERLDGEQTAQSICESFKKRFGQPLSESELQDFLELARSLGFLEAAGVPGTILDRPITAPLSALAPPPTPKPQRKKRQSILYWRISVFDPDRFFNWLEPKIRFIWTRTFLLLSGATILAGGFVLVANSRELVSHFPYLMQWQTVFAAWLALVVVTTCHEFAHGLTCKHHGGQVHEVGFLLMYFMPCFYCNVSDAWLIREKSKRLWVTLAGAYCDLFLWAVAMLIWRLTLQDTLINYLAVVVLSICGIRIFFNFNPLMKLDGYYLLSDWVSIPNLRPRAWETVAARLRWLLWGAARPAREERGTFLVSYGICSWCYSTLFLCLMLFYFFHFLSFRWGLLGAAAAGLLAIRLVPGLFNGLCSGEVKTMIHTRRNRVAIWLIVLGSIVCVLFFVPMEQRAVGNFKLRPTRRAEVRAPVAGFLRSVRFDEGDEVGRDSVLGMMEVPDLASKISQQRADIEEADAKLDLLRVGARHEELLEAHRRVQRQTEWRDLAEQDLVRARAALKLELKQLDELIRKDQIELKFTLETFNGYGEAFRRNAVSQQEYNEVEKNFHVCEAVLEEHRAKQKERVEMGTTLFEAEVARRAQQLADAKSTLVLLEAGTRPEEITAQRARLNSLREELKYLEQLQEKSPLRGGCAGRVVTPHLAEKVGQYFKEGELLLVIEDTSVLEAEISLPEQEAMRVRGGQQVELKLPASPYETHRGTVVRIAPSAVPGDVRSSITIYCSLQKSPEALRPGMSGYARICCGKQPMGLVLGDRVMRSLRTDFWW
ncbi:MAG TPA: efflux RND transporter periplasmic adaptor subunit [Tepidisphaeraceae bacterium]|nr:efflux RND transporter periplasmic adaptor subunit [Tepidisphaeraceae bacterium]